MLSNLPVIFLMGPTAAGKTALAISLCEHLNTEIISVDSALVYKGMDIGTAKRDAIIKIDEFHQQGKVPVLVGGTMLYFKALIDGLSPLPEANVEIRAELEAQAAQYGWPHLYQELVKIDPQAAQKMSENDSQRINRALEVYKLTGKTMTELQKQKQPVLPYTFHQFAIAPTQRSELHQRIEKRFKIMLEQGFENEVSTLYLRKDLHPNMPSIRCVGYRQMWDYLAGEIDHDEMVFRGIAATRQLAKRQLTWLRSWPDVTWLTTGDEENLHRVVSSLS